jgi:hypothetical protein
MHFNCPSWDPTSHVVTRPPLFEQDRQVASASSKVSNTSNHVGVVCTNGTGCAEGTRNLLDLFEVSIDPQNGRAGVIYTNDTLTQDRSGNPLPQIVLAQQQ